jgi:hypothetical protein
MGDVVSDDNLLKKLNLDLLMHTRAEDTRLRLYTLTCSEALWRAHGSKLAGKSIYSYLPQHRMLKSAQALPERQLLSLQNVQRTITIV